MHAKRVCKEFEIKNSGEYHDLYVQSDLLLLADVFGNFSYMCLTIYKLHPAIFLSAPAITHKISETNSDTHCFPRVFN